MILFTCLSDKKIPLVSLDTLSESIKRMAILKRRWQEKILKPRLITTLDIKKNIMSILGKGAHIFNGHTVKFDMIFEPDLNR